MILTFFSAFFLLFFISPAVFSQELSDTSNVSKLSELFKFEQEAHKLSAKDYEQSLLALRSLPQIAVDDEKVSQCLQIRKTFLSLETTIKNARSRQLELINILNQLSGSIDLLPQQTSYVSHYLKELRIIGEQQDTMQRVIRSKLKELQTIVVRIPPPPFFISKAGIKMLLISNKENSFYISELPVSEAVFTAVSDFFNGTNYPAETPAQIPYKGKVNLDQAEKFCQNLSRFEGYTYSIPERSELAWANRRKHIPDIAVWCRSRWSPDWEELEAQKRFGVALYTIWDPNKALSANADSSLSGELKNAAYDQLGFYIVTSVKNAQQQRLKRLQEKLLQESLQED